MNPLIKKIRSELSSMADPKGQESTRRYFKEEIKCYGIRAAGLRMIAKKYWPAVKLLSKKEIVELCEELMKPMIVEETILATLWMPKLKKQFVKQDIELFKKWINRYINNWAACDSFCNHTVGDYLEIFPEQITEVKSWAYSKNRWMRRASAVSLIVPAKRGEFLDDVFEIADILLEDKDDMVQKGYGWMLKEASRKHPDEVFEFVMKHKARMPRTALRYAIELMNPGKKKIAMKK